MEEIQTVIPVTLVMVSVVEVRLVLVMPHTSVSGLVLVVLMVELARAMHGMAAVLIQVLYTVIVNFRSPCWFWWFRCSP